MNFHCTSAKQLNTMGKKTIFVALFAFLLMPGLQCSDTVKKRVKRQDVSDIADVFADLKCECGVFETAKLDKHSLPLLVQKPITVPCNDEGKQTCHEMCTNLGKLSKDKGPSILCAVLGHADDLKPSIHSRICATDPWTYTGLTSKTLICCHDGKDVPCNDEVKNVEE